jgi:hypothetical protein
MRTKRPRATNRSAMTRVEAASLGVRPGVERPNDLAALVGVGAAPFARAGVADVRSGAVADEPALAVVLVRPELLAFRAEPVVVCLVVAEAGGAVAKRASVRVRGEKLESRVRLGPAEGLADALRGTAEVVRGVVGAEVGAVPEDRSILHDPVLEKHLLALAHVLVGEEDLAALVDHPRRNRRLRLVRAVGKKAENEEAKEDD